MVGRSTAAATALTPSKSPGEETANPASTMSTPSRSSCVPISTFSSGDSAMPGDCSPSRNVVSKIVILRLTVILSASVRRRSTPVVRSACAPARRVSRNLPLEGRMRMTTRTSASARAEPATLGDVVSCLVKLR